MNKFIKDQLDKTKIAIPAYNDDTTNLFIKSSSSNTTISDLEIGKYYLIHVENYIINEPENFTLSMNWNAGTKPDDTKLYARIDTINGKMIKVQTRGVNTNTDWSGWLPRKSFTIINELTY